MSQQQAKQQAAQKEQFEGILSLSLIRWLNQIKENNNNLSLFQDDLSTRLNTQYDNIISKVKPQTLNQLDHTLSQSENSTLSTMILSWAASNAIIRASLITNTLQKWRNTMSFTDWKARSRQHIQGTIANTEVQPVYENTKHETAMFVGRSTAFGKVKNKTWITIMDGKEREAHGEANLQKVAMTSDFIVMGESLRFPGDPAGSLPNIINCRCSMIFS